VSFSKVSAIRTLLAGLADWKYCIVQVQESIESENLSLFSPRRKILPSARLYLEIIFPDLGREKETLYEE
jgi:hypothetical protein